MIFTRTASGVANYNKFFGVDIVVFSEGKVEGVAPESIDPVNSVPDQVFYESVFRAINPKWRVKVKCVGNRDSAFKYVDHVRNSKTKSSIVAIDKDCFGVTASYLECPEVIRTHGYSWENDLCSYQLASDVLSDLTLRSAKASNWFSLVYRRTQRRLKFLSVLDVSCQVDGKSLLPKKSATGSLSFGRSRSTIIPIDDIRRLIRKYRSIISPCRVAIDVRVSASRLSAEQIVQGHLWEHAVRHLISIAAARACGIHQPSRQLLLHLLLSKFSADPERYLGTEVFQHYRTQILARLH